MCGLVHNPQTFLNNVIHLTLTFFQIKTKFNFLHFKNLQQNGNITFCKQANNNIYCPVRVQICHALFVRHVASAMYRCASVSNFVFTTQHQSGNFWIAPRTFFPLFFLYWCFQEVLSDFLSLFPSKFPQPLLKHGIFPLKQTPYFSRLSPVIFC